MLFITGVDNNNIKFKYGQSILISGLRETGKTRFITDKILSDLFYEYDNTYIFSSNYFSEWEKYGKMVLEDELKIIYERILKNSDKVIIIIDNYELTNFSKTNTDIITKLVSKTPKNLTIIFENHSITEIPLIIRNYFNYTLLANGIQQDDISYLKSDIGTIEQIGEMFKNLENFEFIGIQNNFAIKIDRIFKN